MSYASYDDMALRFGALTLAQLTDRENQQIPDRELTAAALSDASELIESYAAARYKTPLSPVPAPVRRWCADIAYYLLHGDTVPENVRKLYEDALAGLKDMARGVIAFQADGLPTENAPSGGAGFEAPERMFTGGSLKGF